MPGDFKLRKQLVLFVKAHHNKKKLPYLFVYYQDFIITKNHHWNCAIEGRLGKPQRTAFFLYVQICNFCFKLIIQFKGFFFFYYSFQKHYHLKKKQTYKLIPCKNRFFLEYVYRGINYRMSSHKGYNLLETDVVSCK